MGFNRLMNLLSRGACAPRCVLYGAKRGHRDNLSFGFHVAFGCSKLLSIVYNSFLRYFTVFCGLKPHH